MNSRKRLAALVLGVFIFAVCSVMCTKAYAKDKVKEDKTITSIEEEPEFEMREGGVDVKVKDFKYLGGQEFSITFGWTVTDVIDSDYTIFVHFYNNEYGDPNDEYTVFQFDHQPNTPTSVWKPKKEVIDGPYYITVPDKCSAGVYYIAIGLYNETERYNDITGPDAGAYRTVIGKLVMKGVPEKITDIRFLPLESMKDVKKKK